MLRRFGFGVFFVVTFGACGPQQLPPLGEVLVVVDTDAAVPGLVNRLRIDAFTSGGTWYASRDFDLDAPLQWPTSFGVYSPVAHEGGRVTLRLRAYGDGNVRDYRGERYQARPEGGAPSEIVPPASPPAGDTPRLFDADGSDITPATEPDPLLAIDLLVRLDVPADGVKSASVVLRGACFGTMANVSTGDTCVDTENVLVAAPSPPLLADLTLPTTSLEGQFGAPIPCHGDPRSGHTSPDGTPLYDEEVCVGGGTFIFGRYPDEYPERVAIVDPFLMDKYEVTVARFRDALGRGLSSTAMPSVNDGPIPATADWDSQGTLPFCTYSSAPMGREDFPVTCIDWQAARAFCQFDGGDLPSEVEWEWVAAAAGRASKTAFPWGGPDAELFPCDRGEFGRGFVSQWVTGPCLSIGLGPASVAAADHAGGDRSVGFGIVDLAYNALEWQKDSFDPFDSRCWMEQPLHASACNDPARTAHSLRGGSWETDAYAGTFDRRYEGRSGGFSTTEGFRCVREAEP
jgi:formylglycine-generating enzyme required for sulfatase activity